MGGLLAKKAYLLGQNDEHYRTLVESINAIIFLSTPHRGSNLAEVLNRVLMATLQSARNFIADLSRTSTTLEEINEQFRHVAPRLSIWSFYETLPTHIGPKKIMVLEKDSAMLGYSTEISRPLHADHHGVCKYSSTDDANYVSVRNALGTLVRELTQIPCQVAEQSSDGVEALQGLFSDNFDQDDDVDKHNRLRVDGTCVWIFQENEMSDWMSPTGGCHLVWFSAAPASGKSVLSSYVVTSLRGRNVVPQCFFFNFGDQNKRSVGSLLRALAYQIAKQNRVFRQGLLDLEKSGMRIEKTDASGIWHKVFDNLLFKLDHQDPIYWVIDALDECDSPKVLLDLLRTVSRSRTALRIFITSRQTDVIHIGMAKVEKSLRLTRLAKLGSEHNTQDILRMVRQEVDHMPGSDQSKIQVVKKILARAEGNFLWTRLILEEIASCYSESAVEETLAEFPDDMYHLYDRMEQTIFNLPRQAQKTLAKSLLLWTMGARRPMTLKELSEALEPDFPKLWDLRRTIPDVCGQFIRVDEAGHVTMVHQTAREYLMRPRESDLFIDARANHESLCLRTLMALIDIRTTSEIATNVDTHSYILYAATSWMYHLKASHSWSNQLFDALIKFFSGQSFPLWVQLLSSTSQLDILIKTSKSVASFTALVRKADASKNPLLRRLSDLQLLDQWAIDLVKIVAKFSTALLKHPRAIYSLVSPFSPETSALHQQRHCRNDRDICVTGGADNAWTDRLARISLPEGFEAYKLACAGRFIAILGASGRTMLWNSDNFVTRHVIEHAEPVTCIAFNSQGDQLVTYGLQTTKIWSVPSGDLTCSVDNVEDVRAISMFFTNSDNRVLAGFDDRAVRFFDANNVDQGWKLLHPTLFKEPLSSESAANSPTCVAFSKDGLYAGVAYRGFPLSIWSLESGECINRCNRAQGTGVFSAGKYSEGWYVAWRFCWNPVTNHIVGFYTDGFVFKWHPLTGEHVEAQAYANDVVASSDGKLFLSSTSTGMIKVWDFEDFSIIYQLSSDDLLMGLAFSPDCQRFYDLRVGMVNSLNAWEPNSLLRFSDNEDLVSDLASDFAPSISVAPASEAWTGQFEAVTALAICPNSRCVCVGTDDGSVELRSIHGAETIEVSRFNNFMEVDLLTWSQDAQHIVAVDLSGEISVCRIQVANYEHMVETAQAMKLASPKLDLRERVIHEVVFNLKSTLLLVVTNQSSYVWSLTRATIQAACPLPEGKLRKWLNHPTQDNLILGIGCDDVRIFSWQDLRECGQAVPYLQTIETQPGSHTAPSLRGQLELATEELKKTNLNDAKDASWKLLRASITQNRQHILIRLSSTESFVGPGRLIIFPLSELQYVAADSEQGPSSHAIRTVNVSKSISSRVKIALGILPGDRFVFLDEELWVCSCDLDAMNRQQKSNLPTSPFPGRTEPNIDEVVQRHYFIPDDWAMGGSLSLCCMNADGTLLYPRDDKVSMIKANLHGGGFRRSSAGF